MDNFELFLVALVLPCIITVIIELIVFIIAGYVKKGYFARLVIFTNILTNLLLNFSILVIDDSLHSTFLSSIYNPYSHIFLIAVILEILVVYVEYKIYAKVETPSTKLLWTTIIANIASVVLGFIILI